MPPFLSIVCHFTTRAAFPPGSMRLHIMGDHFAPIFSSLWLFARSLRQQLEPRRNTDREASQHINLVL
jgi:hypothetical protein